MTGSVLEILAAVNGYRTAHDILDTLDSAGLTIAPVKALQISALNADALAEIKATVDGHSTQPVKDIVYGLLAEIAALEHKENEA